MRNSLRRKATRAGGTSSKGGNMEFREVVPCLELFQYLKIPYWVDGYWITRKEGDQWLERYGLKLEVEE